MANTEQTGEDQSGGEGGPATCMACRGTGRVTSGLGGTPHAVVCPWCRGTGERIPGINAQQEPSESGSVTEA
jgi:DnaJ-class molecular chaperone